MYCKCDGSLNKYYNNCAPQNIKCHRIKFYIFLFTIFLYIRNKQVILTWSQLSLYMYTYTYTYKAHAYPFPDYSFIVFAMRACVCQK